MSVVCFGELLIDFVPTEKGVPVGEAAQFIKAAGGAPANVAVAISRLNHPAYFLGMVGDDLFGHFLAKTLREAGVNVEGLRFSREALTALAFVELSSSADRSFIFYRKPSADMLMRPEDVAFELINGQRVFHFGSITLIDEPVKSATLAAVEYAQNQELMIAYDPNLRLNLWPHRDSAQAGMMTGLDYAHIVKVSAEELAFLTGGNDAMALFRPQTRVLAVTHGAAGAALYTRDQVVETAGFPVAAVDTTGAGDAFMAALISGVLEAGDELEDQLVEIGRFACAAGAITTTSKGAIPALPTRQQVYDFLSAN